MLKYWFELLVINNFNLYFTEKYVNNSIYEGNGLWSEDVNPGLYSWYCYSDIGASTGPVPDEIERREIRHTRPNLNAFLMSEFIADKDDGV